MEIQPSLFEEERFSVIVGCDEAGRGPLAGPVCAGAVVLPDDFDTSILDDSKKLSEKKRLSAEIEIKSKAIAWAVCWATPKEIDTINILNASLLAMKRAFDKVQLQLADKKIKADILLVDGNKKPDVDFPCKAIIKGDSLVPQIMAASILAKNERDRFMVCASKRWPVYGFEKHKGYPSKMHKAALFKYGPCPIHRLTFKY